MLTLLFALLVYIVLTVLLWGMTGAVQGYLYTEVAPRLSWRVPAAAGAVWGIGLAWPLLFNTWSQPGAGGLKWPVSFNDMFLFSITQTEMEFERFIVPASASISGRETVYFRKYSLRGGFDYLAEDGTPFPPSTPRFIGIPKGEQDPKGEKGVELERQVDDRGRVRYVNEACGVVMTEEMFGTVTTTRYGQLYLNILAIFLTWAAWFGACWLLLLFQAPHAFLLSLPAFLLWAFMLNFVPL